VFSFKSYLLESGNGTWYFRIGVPHDLRDVFHKSEIKRTLKTTDKKRAQQLAYLYASQCLDQFERIRLVSKEDQPSLPLTKFKITGYDGDTGSFESIETDGTAEDAKAASEFMQLLQETRERRTNYTKADVETLLNDATSSIESIAEPVVVETPDCPEDFSALFEEYIQHKYDEEEWNPAATTGRDHRATFNGFLRITPNAEYKTFNKEDARALRSDLRLLPPNISKTSKLVDLSVEQLKAMKHSKLLSQAAVKKYLNRLHGVFEFAKNEGYVSDNPFAGINQKVTKSKGRLAYSPADLKTVFGSAVFTDRQYKSAWEYWLPLVALHTGARLSELIQLNVADVKTDEGILYLHITDDDPDQRVKTIAGKRTVPVHADLLRLGFAEYVEKLKRKRIKRVFHDVKPYHDKKSGIIDWGKNASRHWNEKTLPSLGIKKDGLVFHSFRHTFITELKYKGVPLAKRQEIIGHESGSGAGKAYEKQFLVSQLKAEVDKTDFSEALTAVKPFK